TRDPDLGKVVLYQLSYSRKLVAVVTLISHRYGRRIIREIILAATPCKANFAKLSSNAAIFVTLHTFTSDRMQHARQACAAGHVALTA
ncbi:hypothetical protein, partial [Pseudescherichia sp.]|uniref:hypothetical protein n=2 Tax=Pseudescherichia sp. TaxID=2055881 RepID=UPI0028AC1C3A